MQTVFFVDIRRLAPFTGRLSPLLRKDRREKMSGYRNSDDRLRCLAGGLFMEYISRGREILYNETGKPFLPEGPYFNLSHSGHFVCLACSFTAPVGIDIEIRRRHDFAALGKTAFHPVERAFFLQQPTMERFFDIWTAKESYVKMLGAGFSVEPSDFCILPESMSLLSEQKPLFHNFSHIEGYSSTLCTPEPIEAAVTTVDELFFDS
jgi:4'-phosphopantetheinyl transferase